MTAAYQHLVSPAHDRSACRACIVTSIMFKLDSHAQETSVWTAALEFAREVERAARSLEDLELRAGHRAESLRSNAKTEGLNWHADQPPGVDGCETLSRLLRYTHEEMRRIARGQLTAFASPDHHTVPQSNPSRPLIKEITRDLARVGFTKSEIADLVDDGHGSPTNTRQKSDAIARVRKRLAEPAVETKTEHQSSPKTIKRR